LLVCFFFFHWSGAVADKLTLQSLIQSAWPLLFPSFVFLELDRSPFFFWLDLFFPRVLLSIVGSPAGFFGACSLAKVLRPSGTSFKIAGPYPFCSTASSTISLLRSHPPHPSPASHDPCILRLSKQPSLLLKGRLNVLFFVSIFLLDFPASPLFFLISVFHFLLVFYRHRAAFISAVPPFGRFPPSVTWDDSSPHGVRNRGPQLPRSPQNLPLVLIRVGSTDSPAFAFCCHRI